MLEGLAAEQLRFLLGEFGVADHASGLQVGELCRFVSGAAR
jgi:hypothetical protein